MGMNNIEAILGCRKKLKLTASEYLFLWYLAFRGNDEEREHAVRGEAWPGYKTIEAEIGLDEDTTRKAAKRLSGLSVMTVHETGYKDRASKTYVVDYARTAEYLKDAVGDSPTSGASITDPQSADYAPPVGGLPTQGRRSTHRTRKEQESNKKMENEEEAGTDSSAASESVSTDDLDARYRDHSVEAYLLPIARDYKLNGNRREEAEKLFTLLDKIGFAENHLSAAIEYFRSIPDTFMAERISTWSGLFKMLESGGMIQQFRSAQHLANKLNPTAYQKAQADSFGTPAYGAAVAKIIEDKKAGKNKKNPATF